MESRVTHCKNEAARYTDRARRAEHRWNVSKQWFSTIWRATT
jgi:hypothetical protein